MADIAIDPTDIRPSQPEPAKTSRRRKTLLVAGGVALGIAAIGGAGVAILSSLKLPSSLSGLAFLPKPDAPRRSEIRIGGLPDMPEIRDGVPAIVGTKPVRVVETAPPPPPAPIASAPRPVSVVSVPPVALPSTPVPTILAATASQPAARFEAFVANAPVRADATPAVGPIRAAAAAPVLPLVTPPVASPDLRAANAPPAASPAVRANLAPTVEPAATASVPTAVPLPPPAPARGLAGAPEGKPERNARPTQVGSRQGPQPVTPSPTEGAVPPAPPPEDRIEILGVKLPNGSDLRNAVSSIGEALNLPKAF